MSVEDLLLAGFKDPRLDLLRSEVERLAGEATAEADALFDSDDRDDFPTFRFREGKCVAYGRVLSLIDDLA